MRTVWGPNKTRLGLRASRCVFLSPDDDIKLPSRVDRRVKVMTIHELCILTVTPINDNFHLKKINLKK